MGENAEQEFISTLLVPWFDEETEEREKKQTHNTQSYDTKEDFLIEVRPGVGGTEAQIFAREIFDMYQRHYDNFSVLQDNSDTLLVGEVAQVRKGEIIQEAGVHRVQRVPETETKGRIQTSSVAVVVLPKIVANMPDLKAEDVEIFTKKSSGPGGQSVNTGHSAVRLTHIPTKLTVNMLIHDSQVANKKAAWEVLRTKVHNLTLDKLNESKVVKRSAQVNTGDRSEKIRTFNFQRDEVKDHRFFHEIIGANECLYGKGFETIVEGARCYTQECTETNAIQWFK